MLERMTAVDLTHHVDVAIALPAPGVIRVQSKLLFATPDNPLCLRFLRRVFGAEELRGLTITNGHLAIAELAYDATAHAPRRILARLAECLECDGATFPPQPTERPRPLHVAPLITATDRHGISRYHRYGRVVTGTADHRAKNRRAEAQEPGSVPQGRAGRCHRARAHQRARGGPLSNPQPALYGKEPAADVVLLGGSYDALADLVDSADTFEAEVAGASREATLPNLLWIAGAFGGLLNGITAGIIANVCVLNVDRHLRRTLDESARRHNAGRRA